MTSKTSTTLVASITVFVFALAVAVYYILSPATLSREELSANGLFVYAEAKPLKNFNLIDQNGQAFTADALNGKWTLVFFGYTFCPDVCPLTMATVSQFTSLLEGSELSDDTQVVMVSVDPMRDTPEILGTYMAYFDKAFIGATGEQINIFALASQLNAAFSYEPLEGDGYLVNHSGHISLINPAGELHGFFKTPHVPEKMAANYSAVTSAWN